MPAQKAARCRRLVMVLGDQLNRDSAAFDDFDVATDVVVMVEALTESTHVWSHKARTALFLSAMRHFARDLQANGIRVEYCQLDVHRDESLATGWLAAIQKCQPESLICVEPGDLRVWQMLNETAAQTKLPLDLRGDRHFMCSREAFARWAGDSKSLRMEFFYRQMRREHNVLMECGGPRWTSPHGSNRPPSRPSDRCRLSSSSINWTDDLTGK